MTSQADWPRRHFERVNIKTGISTWLRRLGSQFQSYRLLQISSCYYHQIKRPDYCYSVAAHLEMGATRYKLVRRDPSDLLSIRWLGASIDCLVVARCTFLGFPPSQLVSPFDLLLLFLQCFKRLESINRLSKQLEWIHQLLLDPTG